MPSKLLLKWPHNIQYSGIPFRETRLFEILLPSIATQTVNREDDELAIKR